MVSADINASSRRYGAALEGRQRGRSMNARDNERKETWKIIIRR